MPCRSRWSHLHLLPVVSETRFHISFTRSLYQVFFGRPLLLWPCSLQSPVSTAVSSIQCPLQSPVSTAVSSVQCPLQSPVSTRCLSDNAVITTSQSVSTPVPSSSSQLVQHELDWIRSKQSLTLCL